MILRNLSRSLKEQNWTAIWIEFVLLVAGVFLGIQVANWNAALGDGKEATTYRQRLADDLRSELSGIETRMAYYQRVRSHALNALAGAQQPAEQANAQFLIDAYQATQEWPFNPARSAYEEMISAGRMNLIPDLALRKRLAVHYSELGEYLPSWSREAEYRNSMRTLMPVALQERIHIACETFAVDQAGSSQLMPESMSCAVSFTPEEIASAVAAINLAPDLAAQINRQVSVIDEKLRMFSDRHDQVNAMIDYMKVAP